MKKTFIYTAVAMGVLSALNPAMAEETAAEELEAIEVVGTMNKLDIQPFNQAKSATVIPAETLQEQGIEKADELGRYQAGFTSQVFGSDTNTNWFRIRGSEASQTIDGSPMLEQGFFTPQVETYGLEAVEVIKGADSMTYGAANAGGLINYISKRPTKDKVGHGELTTHFGNKNQRGVAGDYTGSLNEDNSLRYRIVGSYKRFDGEWAGTWAETYYIAPSLAWDISDKTHLTILASYMKNVGTPSSNFYPQDGTLISSTGTKLSHHTNLGDPTEDYEKSISRSIGYEFDHNFGNGLSFSQNYRYQEISSRHHGAYIYPSAYDAAYTPITFAQQGNGNVSANTVYNNGTAKSHTIDNRFTWKFKNEAVDNTLVAGMDYRNQKFDSLYSLYAAGYTEDVFNPNASYGSSANVFAPQVKIKSRQTGYYLQDNLILWEKIGLTAGIRHDRVRQNYSSSDGTRQMAENNHTSYSGSIMYFNDLGLNPYYAYTESFRLPTGLSGNYKLYDANITKQHEVGVKYMPSWLDGTISLAYFQAKDDGALVMNSLTGATISSPDPIKRKGFELQAQANITDRLTGSFAYTYLKSVTDSSGNKIRNPLIPTNTLSARLAYQFTDAFNGGVGVRYVGHSVTSNGSLYSGYQVPSATVVDLFARYDFSQHLSTQLNINNLGNRKYIAGCDYYCYYAEGINAVASVSYKF